MHNNYTDCSEREKDAHNHWLNCFAMNGRRARRGDHFAIPTGPYPKSLISTCSCQYNRSRIVDTSPDKASRRSLGTDFAVQHIARRQSSTAPQSATPSLRLLIPLSHASTRHSSIKSLTVRSDPRLLRSFSKPMGEPLPPPQQQCAAPLPNRPEEEALHLDHSSPASSTPDQPPMQTSADAAAASTHADRQTDVPPLFWSTRQHSRSTSYHSISHLSPGTIQLEDHSEEQHEQSQGCWARSVTVDDYTVVSGPSGIGSFVTWHLTVSTLKGGDMSIRKRYVLGFYSLSSAIIDHSHAIYTYVPYAT
jgi:hypothetical protein